jgi:hypothetical protein
VIDDTRDGDTKDLTLENHETVHQATMCSAAGADTAELQLAVFISARKPADDLIKAMSALPTLTIGTTGTTGNGDNSFKYPTGSPEFVPACPEWLVCSDTCNERVKIHNVRTGALVCKWGAKGEGEGYLQHPNEVTVTADIQFVLVVERMNSRVQVGTSKNTRCWLHSLRTTATATATVHMYVLLVLQLH